MSKFFEALERSETEVALRTIASSPRSTEDLAAAPAPEAPSVEVLPAAPRGFPPPVFEAPSTAIHRVVGHSNRVETHLVSLIDSMSYEAHPSRVHPYLV